MPTTDIRVALAGALLVLALTGCSAAAEPVTSEAAAEHGTAEGEAVAYPPGFPTDRVPLLDGTLLHVAHPGNLWAAWIESDDLVADLATASGMLVDAGYTISNSADGFLEATDGERSLRIIASDDSTYGPCLAYTITDGAAEADDAEQQDSGESEGGDH